MGEVTRLQPDPRWERVGVARALAAARKLRSTPDQHRGISVPKESPEAVWLSDQWASERAVRMPILEFQIPRPGIPGIPHDAPYP